MQRADIPTRFPIPWGDSAVAPYIHDVPEDSQVTVTPGAASLETGFPPLNFTVISAGGVPPKGDDMNGILKQITQWSQWQAAAGPVPYDATFSTSIGGYPEGATVASETYDGYVWLCTADDNTVDPDTGSPDVPATGWTPVALQGGALTTGAWTWRPTSEDVPGWVKANGGTLGNASSGASLLASAQAAALFAWFWRNFSNTICPVLPSGRGASAAADFAANKTIAVVSLRGTSIVGMDTMAGGATTNLSGVPVTNGSATAAGSLLGENLHAMALAENAAHDHGGNTGDDTPDHTHTISPAALTGVGGVGVNGSSPLGTVSQTQGASVRHHHPITSSGSGTPHNTVALSITGSMYWKL